MVTDLLADSSGIPIIAGVCRLCCGPIVQVGAGILSTPLLRRLSLGQSFTAVDTDTTITDDRITIIPTWDDVAFQRRTQYGLVVLNAHDDGGVSWESARSFLTQLPTQATFVVVTNVTKERLSSLETPNASSQIITSMFEYSASEEFLGKTTMVFSPYHDVHLLVK